MAASFNGFKGLLIVKSPLLACTIGLVLAMMAFVWFFASTPRNINDFEGGLDANDQALYLFLGVLTAVVSTLLVSSAVNVRLRDSDLAPDEGLDALKHTNYVRALSQSIRSWWKEWNM